MQINIKILLAILFFTPFCYSQDEPEEKKYYLPPYKTHLITEVEPASEIHPGFLTNRGDYAKLKALSGNGKGIKIGIVDTGLDYTHSRKGGELELADPNNPNSTNVAVREVKDFTTPTRRRWRRRGSQGWYDKVGHGTHVAGHIGARANGKGIEGIASECELYIAKGLGDQGFGTETQLANAILWLIQKDVDIINLSLGGGYSSRIEAAVKLAQSKGILVFAAIGNEGEAGGIHPGISKYTFGISAVDYNYKRGAFSSIDDRIDYSGFGVKVYSTINGGRYAEFTGTSMSTPDQVGIAALILGYAKKIGKPINGMSEYHKFVSAGIADLGIDGKDNKYGYGFIVLEKIITDNPEEANETNTPEDLPTNPIDTGDPMEPEKPQRIFERFRKIGERIFRERKALLLEDVN